ncbi:hypothetical protein NQ314_010586 [Rhamnusium bicolor]|uniref:DDE Tnp4 domain-containing protein n=1 Tax=Rhamnusium bicolor TaxID=1586634 RepID=A0AAV8XPQ7_9CUCU|nr:hypothetical protein NQ314_010586 [Rhamnusium bicolor]
MNRESQGDWNNLVVELRLDSNRFHNYFRMSVELFDKLVCIVGPSLQKIEHYRKDIIPVGALTLRFLASGDSHMSLSYSYRIGKATVSLIITKGPPNSGSEFFNYKHSHSIVLMAIVDHSYRFIMVDIGASGRQSDGGVFKTSNIGNGFENKLFNLPTAKPLCEDGQGYAVPYVLVGDEAFQLTEYLLRPYPGRGGLDIVKKNGSLIGGEWRNEPDPIYFRNINGASLGSNRSFLRAAELRETFANYFVSDEGSINWQWDNI